MSGVVFWSLEHDDFNNRCGNGSWPLLRSLARELPQDSSRAPTVVPRARPSTLPSTGKATASRVPSSTSAPIIPISPSMSPYSTTPGFHTDFSGERLFGENGDDKAHPHPPSSSSSASSSSAAGTDAFSTEDEGLSGTTMPSFSDPVHSKSSQSDPEATNDIDPTPGYRQCKLANLFGPSLTCPSTRGKPGDPKGFYLYCFSGFFAIECHCLPGYFFNRCLQLCDVNSNFRKCPIVH
ncbi:probable chitinase 10 [Aplysia californica]|uniref:Probable chitinase 10 n=1 Tax=Aplysia californica TaxID=6500 RepID=A0ABM0ZUJ2_APLCA|nr:probable chitinase 10 [Aplysia californica]